MSRRGGEEAAGVGGGRRKGRRSQDEPTAYGGHCCSTLFQNSAAGLPLIVSSVLIERRILASRSSAFYSLPSSPFATILMSSGRRYPCRLLRLSTRFRPFLAVRTQPRTCCLKTWPKRNCRRSSRKDRFIRSTRLNTPPAPRHNWPNSSGRKGPVHERCRAVSLPRSEPGVRGVRSDAGLAHRPSPSNPLACRPWRWLTAAHRSACSPNRWAFNLGSIGTPKRRTSRLLELWRTLAHAVSWSRRPLDNSRRCASRWPGPIRIKFRFCSDNSTSSRRSMSAFSARAAFSRSGDQAPRNRRDLVRRYSLNSPLS